MRQKTGSAMSDVEKVQMLMDMGLTQDNEAVVIEKSMPLLMPQSLVEQDKHHLWVWVH